MAIEKKAKTETELLEEIRALFNGALLEQKKILEPQEDKNSSVSDLFKQIRIRRQNSSHQTGSKRGFNQELECFTKSKK